MADWLDSYGTPSATPTPTPAPAPAPNPPVNQPGNLDPNAWLNQYEPILSPESNVRRDLGQTLSPILQPAIDLASRTQYASANAAGQALQGNFGQIPKAIEQGLTGDVKGSYLDLANQYLPEGTPPWLKGAIGTAANIFLDPLTYTGIGTEGKVISLGGKSLLGARADAAVLGSLKEASNAAKATPAGRWVLKHFSTKGPISDEEFWKRYQLARDEAEFLINQAIHRNVPLEQAVGDVERQLGVPRDVIMNLVEKPITYHEEVATQHPLPLTITKTDTGASGTAQPITQQIEPGYQLHVDQPNLPLTIQPGLPKQEGAMVPASSIPQSEPPLPAGTPKSVAQRLRNAERQLETDTLTGLGSVKALNKALPVAEKDPAMAVLTFDANNFGQINKIQSQKAGDQMIKKIAKAVKDSATKYGYGERVFRRGGDEIVVLAPKDVAAQIINDAEANFGTQVIKGQDQSVEVSLTGTAGNTFDQADAGLQEAKKARKAGLPRPPGPDLTVTAPAEPPQLILHPEAQQGALPMQIAPAQPFGETKRVDTVNVPPTQATQVPLNLPGVVQKQTLPYGEPYNTFPEHTVAEGETVETLASKFHTTPQRIKELNGIKRKQTLEPGQVIRVPDMVRTDRVAAYPSEVGNVVDQFKQLQATRIQKEQAAGIGIQPFDSDIINYMGHFLTPEAREALKKMGGTGTASQKFRALLDARVQHASTQYRGFLRDLPVSEINGLSREGAVIPGFTGNLFREDPVMVNTIRDIIGARATSAAQFLQDVTKNPDWSQPAAAVAGVGGWRPLTPTAAKRFGPLVDGMVFRPDIADALDHYVQKAFDPNNVDLFVKTYDKWLGIWKSYTLGTSPSWMTNNLLGNMWNGFVLGGASPAALKDSFRILNAGRKTAEYTIKPGETLSGIADRFNVDATQLAKANGIKDPNKIFAGDQLKIPGSTLQGKLKGFTDQEILNLAERYGVLFKGLYGSEIKKSLEEQLGRGTAKKLATLPVEPTFKANQVLENWTRLGLFVDGLKKGLDPEKSALRVKKFLFDYQDLTPTEQNILKRVIPFYSWIRKNLPLQIQGVVQQPGKYTALTKATEYPASLENNPEPGVALPPWMQEGLYMHAGNPASDVQRLLSLSGLPPTDLIRYAAAASQGNFFPLLGANPVVAALLAASGVNPQSGEAIDATSQQRVGPAIMPERAAQALYSIFPPARTLARMTDPSTNPFVQERAPLLNAALFMLGAKVYDRNITLDERRVYTQMHKQLSDLKSNAEMALERGDEGLANKYLKQAEQLIQNSGPILNQF